LRFGLILPTLGTGAGPEGLEAAADAVSRLGWSSLWVTDHMLIAPSDEAKEYGWILEALTSLAWVGARHPDLQLGTSVVIPAMRDAPQLAKELATIDHLSGGRLTVGVGVGDAHDAPEWANLGKSERMSVRGAYLDETIGLWRHLWGGSNEPFHGRFHTLDSFVFAPLPPQGERLPIWCGGRSERAMTRAASLCDGYHASQTGPDDLRQRLPFLSRLRRELGLPRLTLSIRARVRFGAPRGPVYALSGSSREMVADLEAFDDLGVDELVVVLEGVGAEAAVRSAERFDSEVIQPFRRAKRERQDAIREQYSM
jgi:alkanesulfonate monooxygenase SsuD/methylene tetrahydromethanopterin reductase-like flavin-dependent oxidoreductase (luciferase family)